TRDPQRSDVRSVFAGLRPLVKAKGKTTSALSRDHLISTADSGLISIIGGKWTTYRHMAEQVIDTAAREAGLTVAPTPTRTLQLAGHNEPPPDVLALDERTIEKSIRTEACLTVEDMLARRSRMLLLDARKAMAETPRVAATMARILRYDGEWEQQQINAFTQTAQQYILN
ncbi:MAG: FAD-dependent oxidoreductase, partial [Chitinophagaceae bacterium]|nr:FAD-dependent oxidoreductase [Chitinophagaceae bacterium]